MGKEIGEGGGERVGILVGGERIRHVDVLSPGLALQLVGLECADVRGGGRGGFGEGTGRAKCI